ncbi:hypothetical protein OUZ56_017291 [Daphnia magna]|uniref:Uncharacterized protein n=1 Tax=Daphnia magna TaxID=35525 RepID=A0ABR0ASL3_9CRUS|nr:hypothetical protein OUZ56_017291 [Daphnia magna]
MEGFNAVKKNNEETLVMDRDSEDAVQRSEATDGEINYMMIECDIETEIETQREGLLGDYEPNFIRSESRCHSQKNTSHHTTT